MKLRDFLRGVALMVVEKKHFPLGRAQRREQHIEIPFQAGLLGFQHGQRGRFGLIERGELEAIPPPILVDEKMPDRGEEERARLHAAVAPREIQPRFLHEILRLRLAMRESQCIAVALLQEFGVGERGRGVGGVQTKGKLSPYECRWREIIPGKISRRRAIKRHRPFVPTMHDSDFKPLRARSAANTSPAQIGFNPEGDVLLVTERSTNTITTFSIGENGLPISQQSVASLGVTPFGFAFSGRAKVFVTNAAGGAAGASSVSSYFVDEDGSTLNLANAVPTTQGAACWLAVTGSGRYAYSANTGSSTVSRFRIGSLGSLTLLDNTATGGLAGPIDAGVSSGDHFLYVLNGRGDTTRAISAFAIAAAGSLTSLAGASGLPAGSNGLIVR